MLKNYYQIIKRLLYILINNPRFFFKRIFLELRAFVSPTPKFSAVKKINGILFEFDFNYSPKMKKMYFNTYQPSVAEILRIFLKKGDTFIDVGANIGYLSALAAGLIGSEGEVHSFEPVPEYYQKLKKFAKINSQYKIYINQFALGNEEKSGTIYIKGGPDIGYNTFFPALLSDSKNRTAQVSIQRLDEYIKEREIKNIKLIKIDVEGFEFPVLKGLSRYFSECQNKNSCPLIICEVCPGVYASFGHKLQDLFDYMRSFSYYPFKVLNIKKRIDINKMNKKQVVDIMFKFCK